MNGSPAVTVNTDEGSQENLEAQHKKFKIKNN